MTQDLNRLAQQMNRSPQAQQSANQAAQQDNEARQSMQQAQGQQQQGNQGQAHQSQEQAAQAAGSCRGAGSTGRAADGPGRSAGTATRPARTGPGPGRPGGAAGPGAAGPGRCLARSGTATGAQQSMQQGRGLAVPGGAVAGHRSNRVSRASRMTTTARTTKGGRRRSARPERLLLNPELKKYARQAAGRKSPATCGPRSFRTCRRSTARTTLATLSCISSSSPKRRRSRVGARNVSEGLSLADAAGSDNSLESFPCNVLPAILAAVMFAVPVAQAADAPEEGQEPGG